MAEQARYETTRTAFGCGVVDRQNLGRPVVRAGMTWTDADRITDALNELNEEACFLRAILCGHGIEVRPTRRAG